MKKRAVVSLGLCLMLALSGINAYGDAAPEEEVFDASRSGVTFTVPEEYKSAKGTIDCLDMGDDFEVGEGKVEVVVNYYPFSAEELERLEEEEGEAEANGELDRAWELLDEMNGKNVFRIIGIDGDRGIDELIDYYMSALDPEQLKENKVEMPEEEIEAQKEEILSGRYTEIGRNEGFTYIVMSPDPEVLKDKEPFEGYGDEFYEEYISLLEGVDSVIESMQLTGGVELAVPVELAETGSEIHFETTDLDGNPIDSKELFAGHTVTMLNLWGTWCGPCIRELPELEELNQELLPNNGQIIGIVTDADSDEKINKAKDILSDKGVTYVNLAAFEGLSELLPQDSWPTSYFVDENGCLIGEPVPGAYFDQYRERLGELLPTPAA